MTISFTVPLPPSVNHCYGRNRNYVYMKREAVAWKAIAKPIICKVMENHAKLKGKVIVEMTVFWKDGRRRDTDNLMKLTLDVMKGVVFSDDFWSLPRVMDFSIDPLNPRLEISARKA